MNLDFNNNVLNENVSTSFLSEVYKIVELNDGFTRPNYPINGISGTPLLIIYGDIDNDYTLALGGVIYSVTDNSNILCATCSDLISPEGKLNRRTLKMARCRSVPPSSKLPIK